MPDAHSGYSMPIGGVCSTKGVIVPQFVGFDIGCGMCAYQTNYTKDDINKYAKKIYDKIIERIPLGFNRHKKQQKLNLDMPHSELAEYFLNTISIGNFGWW